jgi:hypothetical protein
MLSAGIDSPARLAKKCKVSRQTVTDWLAMDTAQLSGENVYLLSKCLGVRVTWLIAEEGGLPGWDHFDRALAVLSKLNGERVEEWLAIGERMAG